jgi:hypothetical protein
MQCIYSIPNTTHTKYKGHKKRHEEDAREDKCQGGPGMKDANYSSSFLSSLLVFHLPPTCFFTTVDVVVLGEQKNMQKSLISSSSMLCLAP